MERVKERMQGWASQVPQPAPPSGREAIKKHYQPEDLGLTPMKERVNEGAAQAVRSLDTYQESCFTSKTLGRLKAGWPQTSSPLGCHNREGKGGVRPGNRDPLSLLLPSLTQPGFSEPRPISHVALPRHPAPAPSAATFGIKIASSGKKAMLHGGKRLLL